MAVLLALAGLVLLVTGFRRLRRSRSFRTRAARATVVVMEQRLQAPAALPGLPTSRWRFQTADGGTVTFISDIGSMPAHAPGSGIGVLYDPDRPADARIDSPLRTSGRAALELILAACMLGGSLTVLAARWAISLLPAP